jgi:hypothetical protein
MASLFEAIYADQVGKADAALAAGADANGLEQATGFTPLTLALELNSAPAIPDALVRAGASLHLANGYGSTPLLSALAWKNMAWVQTCLCAGADVRVRGVVDDFLTSPAHEACYWGMTDVLLELLQRDSTVMQLRAHRGLTPREFMRLNEATLTPQDFAIVDEAVATLQASTCATAQTDTRHMFFALADLDDASIDWTARLNRALPLRDWPTAIVAAEMGAECAEYVRAHVHRSRYSKKDG